eukprot:753140-Hanusia_phi.AAC.5
MKLLSSRSDPTGGPYYRRPGRVGSHAGPITVSPAGRLPYRRSTDGQSPAVPVMAWPGPGPGAPLGRMVRDGPCKAQRGVGLEYLP